jgi:uncharacterized protein (TIGR02145 family)
MKRFFTLLFFCCLSVAFADAQPETVNGFAVGGGVDAATGSEAIIGQPFSEYAKTASYSVTLGVGQSQLVTEAYTATVSYGDGYHDAWFDYDASTAPGTHLGKRYLANGTPKKYDLLKVLTLKIIGGTGGCSGTVADADGHVYHMVPVAHYCWTKENLYATHYADAGLTAIARTGVYNAPGFTDETANEGTYGRLYTWYSAVGLPEDGSGTLTPDANGYVQGVCPVGWHIPTAVEKAALDALSTEDIRTSELWLSPNSNTNSTGFTSLPAGLYNAASGQFEQILMNTGYWSLSNGTAAPTTIATLPYYCNHPIERAVSASDMLSVRCVKND